MKNSYPRFLPVNPQGRDLTYGHSQTNLGQAIARHMLDIDDSEKDLNVTRIIGVEGGWGSGKSNVISYLKDTALNNKNYVFLEYDAWSRQEDLHRCSVLQLLLRDLIDQKLLTETTKMRVAIPSKDGTLKYEETEVTWERRLNLLLSKAKRTISRRQRNIYPEFKWFMLAFAITPIAISLTNACKPATICPYCWTLLVLLAAVLPISIFELAMLFHNHPVNSWFKKTNKEHSKETPNDNKQETYSWKRVFEIYLDTNKADEQAYDIINEAEPSQIEFEKWMEDISKELGGKNKKYVVVFDNMDRLSKEKVKQLWSIIHLLFSGKTLENIWCIIPFDFEHLATAFGENSTDCLRLTKLFIEKSFPIVYRVPQPIIADYKNLFKNLIHEAFGETEAKDDLDVINQCYRRKFPKPNIREIISFINTLVGLRRQWDDLNFVTIALYALQRDEMFYNHNDNGDKAETIDNYILNKSYCKDFANIIMSTDSQVKEFAALVFGVQPKQAYQLMVKRILLDKFRKNTTKPLNDYVETAQFFDILDDAVHEVDFADYDKLITSLDLLDTKYESQVSHIWKYIAKQYQRNTVQLKEYSKIEHIVLTHVDDGLQDILIKKICNCLTTTSSISGRELYTSLKELFNEPFAKQKTVLDFCPFGSFEAQIFLDYVDAAGKNYEDFPIITDAQRLNEYLIASLTDGSEHNYAAQIQILKDNPRYKVKEVGDKAAELIPRYINQGDYIYKIISTLRVLKIDVKANLRNLDTTRPWLEQQGKVSGDVAIEYYLMYVMGNNYHDASLPSDVNIKDVVQKVLFYRTSAELLELVSRNPIGSIKNIVSCMIRECIHDEKPQWPHFVEKWNNLKGFCGLESYTQLLDFAESWGYNHLSEEEITMNVKGLIPATDIFKDCLVHKSDLAVEIVNKVKKVLYAQPLEAVVTPDGLGRSTDLYWNNVFNLLVSNSIIERDVEWCQNLAYRILNKIATGSQLNDEYLQKFVLTFKFKDLSSKIIDTRDKILHGDPLYLMTSYKFVELHYWLESAKINSSERRDDAATRIIAKIVHDTQCQKIILDKKDFYQPIFTETIETASDLQRAVQDIRQNQTGVFVDWLNEIYPLLEMPSSEA